MAFLATHLGLRAVPIDGLTPNYAPAYLGFHFVYAYCILASRNLKQIYGIDHQASPREDLVKYGDAAVKSGKITQRQLNMLKRNEGAHANSVENYTLFVGAMGFATFAGVKAEYVNRAGLIYTAARVAYAVSYILIEKNLWAVSRGVFWWIGNGSCLWLLWEAGKILTKGDLNQLS
ncbi:hypothetical protein BKA67DRAFT_547008 [Truncatella angustata]|uniref:Uncharacterized protein n=1 Tax=Truncatella angustata TaxID=152316 RepID=A0A9P8UX41_9PEZI|nr:uncharacterized protein BKA67DRAFT_547008 [Truncatella angustata]KAH6660146.1 hypothetical protein BKA67DRAFT_547008 [Truncatella angustata]KAH8202591.1 hypothetical protein TruAng_003192 [Truncatella angustata]